MLLEIKNLRFQYPGGQPLFENLNLSIEKGKIIALAGESGCGKTTLLRLIYGLLDWEKGDIIFHGRPIYGPKQNIVPGEAPMKLVAQDYDLMPYATVAENIGKYISNIRLEDKRNKVNELLAVVGLEDYAHTLPKNLSGGQQQRVAIARALSVLPELLLLDEPFSNLDFARKAELRERLFGYTSKMGISVMISTHDIQEVLPWLDQIIVLKNGRLIQKDTPEETYKNPYNAYVAQLFGEVNIFSNEEKVAFNLAKNFYFPNEIILSGNGRTAQVLESRFAGGHFWNKISLNGKPLVVYSKDQFSGEIKIEF